MGPASLRGIKLARSRLKERNTSRLEVSLEYTPLWHRKTLRDSHSPTCSPAPSTRGATWAASSQKTRLARGAESPRLEAHMYTHRGSGARPGAIPLVAAETRLSRHQVFTVRLSHIQYVRAHAAPSMCSLRGRLAGAPKATLAARRTALAANRSCSSADKDHWGGTYMYIHIYMLGGRSACPLDASSFGRLKPQTLNPKP